MARHQFDDYISLDQSTGKQFESDFISELTSNLNNKYGKDYVIPQINTKLDIEQGTDLSIADDNIRIDITCNFSKKNNMPFYTESDIPAVNYHNLKFGIRIGNNYKGYKDFEKPVVVIGIDLNNGSEYNNHMNPYLQLCDNIKTHYQKILDMVFDVYDDYTITDPEERKELTRKPLNIKNENYTTPKKGTKYEKLNKMRDRLDSNNNLPESDNFEINK